MYATCINACAAQVRYLEACFGLLIGVMVTAFGVMAVKAGVPVGEVVRGFLVPHLKREHVPTVSYKGYNPWRAAG